VFYVVRNPRWLFGDTVNTAKKAWSNGIRNLIQVFTKTADLLIAAGKSIG
jgi:hypothetical protein